MTRGVLAALVFGTAAIVAAPVVARAQNFKVDKFDIKGDGGTDYVAAEPATGRVFVSRGDHMMVVDGATGKVLGDITNTPGVHGAGIVTKVGHGFTTNGGDMTVTMFDLKTLAVIKRIMVGPGLARLAANERAHAISVLVIHTSVSVPLSALPIRRT